MRFLIKFLCCFVPLRKWRRKIRHNLISLREQRKELIEHGYTINADILTTPEGIRLDVSKELDNSLYLIIEVFLRNEYNLNITKESVLIDIGMNRGAASLLFAANENIEKIYAYEPFKPTFESAHKNFLLNPKLSKKITPRNFGLGKAEAKLELPYSPSASVGMSTTHEVCKKMKDARKETVHIKDAAKEFETIIDTNKNRYLIVKCDCEGAEFEILERLNEKGILNKIDVIMMEYHFESPNRLINILNENHFAVKLNTDSGRAETGYLYAVRMEKKEQ